MSNNKQQTAVAQIVNLLNKEGFAPVLTEEEIKFFKEMEKEQMIEFGELVWKNLLRSDKIRKPRDVYNETYGGNK